MLYCNVDIGLIKLPDDQRFDMGPGRNIGIITLNSQMTKGMLINAAQNSGQRLRISGWGLDQTEQPQRHLKIGHVNLADLTVGGQHIDQIIFGYPSYGQWNCRGDSGGKYWIKSSYVLKEDGKQRSTSDILF